MLFGRFDIVTLSPVHLRGIIYYYNKKNDKSHYIAMFRRFSTRVPDIRFANSGMTYGIY